MPPGESVREESPLPQGLVLHAAWDPATRGVFLWGEAPPGGPSPRKSKKAGALPPHPRAALAEALREAIPALGKARPARRILAIPSSEEGPLASYEALGLTGLTLQKVDVPGIALLPDRSVVVLPSLQDALQGGAEGAPRMGDDLRWWIRASLFALSLLARGRFVPEIVDGLASWRAVLTDPADAALVESLARGMPGSARAVLEEKDDEELAGPPPRAVLTEYLNTVLDDLVREDVHASRALEESEDLAAEWLLKLGEGDAEIDGDEEEVDDLEDDIAAWLAPVAATQATFRASFHLEPPPPLSEEERIDDVAPAGKEPWTLQYFFEASDDPNLSIPLEEVWRHPEPVLRVFDRTIKHPQERALEDLGLAAREFRPIARSLREAAPSRVTLTANEALEFMRTGGAALEEMGFGVVLPGGRGARRGGKKLQVKLTLREPPEGSRMGLGALVDYRWDIVVGDRVLTNAELDRYARLKVPLVRVGDEWVEISEEEIRETRRYWTSRRREGLTLGEALQIQAGEAKAGPREMAVATVEATGNLGDVLARLAPVPGAQEKERSDAFRPPAGFVGILRPYQERGVAWLTRLDTAGIGALLADDMGLGKTVQVLALLLQAKETEREKGPTLLLCPTSVVANWEREARKFAPTLRVHVHHGSGREEGTAFRETATAHDLVLSTYSLAARDEVDLAAVPWGRVILDEAQNIKNPDTLQSRAVRNLGYRAPHRIAMTGTPVENRLAELWSIMDFLNPGYLGGLQQFRRTFAIPIERLGDEETAAKLRSLIRPFILRRVKTDPKVIQDLPEKIEQKVVTNLTREQVVLYENIVEEMMEQIEKAEGIARKGLVLTALTKLKQVCDHPILVLPESERGPVAGLSGKLSRLEEMLEEALSEGDKALVFTQYAEMGKVLAEHLPKALGSEVLFLHGGVARKKREELVQRFQDKSGPPVFILSLKAGGVGLNLTQGNHVFHFDRWWNPAVEDQATDRAFRIGQTKNVMVHKFMAAGTLEEKIDTMIEGKRNLAEAIVGGGEAWVTNLSNSELRELMSLRREVIETTEGDPAPKRRAGGSVKAK